MIAYTETEIYDMLDTVNCKEDIELISEVVKSVDPELNQHIHSTLEVYKKLFI